MTTASPPDGSDVRRMFDDLLDHEPPMELDARTTLRTSRRLRRRRQTTVGLLGIAAVGAVGAAGVGLVVVQTDDEPDTVTVEQASPLGAVVTPDGLHMPAGATRQAEHSPLGDEVRAAVEASSPSGWTFDLSDWAPPGGLHDAVLLVGTVDDRAGPTDLVVTASADPDQPMVHGCTRFPSGFGDCTETVRSDGSVLSIWSWTATNGLVTVGGELTHPDGTGVSVQSANFLMPLPDAPPDEPTAVRAPESPSREHPTYSTEQLTAVLEAVDAVLR